MSFTIIHADKFNTINWSGGTSTQLYIYPETSDYALRNFDFRLSTAKVEVEKSDFTPLPGVLRKIMILDGEIEISHKDQYTKTLEKFEIDEFKGDWATSSVGTCIDFNLMTREGKKGEISSMSLIKAQTFEYSLTKQLSKLFIYIYSGQICFNLDCKEHILKQGELLILDSLNDNSIQLNAYEDSDLIITQLFK